MWMYGGGGQEREERENSRKLSSSKVGHSGREAHTQSEIQREGGLVLTASKTAKQRETGFSVKVELKTG